MDRWCTHHTLCVSYVYHPHTLCLYVIHIHMQCACIMHHTCTHWVCQCMLYIQFTYNMYHIHVWICILHINYMIQSYFIWILMIQYHHMIWLHHILCCKCYCITYLVSTWHIQCVIHTFTAQYLCSTADYLCILDAWCACVIHITAQYLCNHHQYHTSCVSHHVITHHIINIMSWYQWLSCVITDYQW